MSRSRMRVALWIVSASLFAFLYAPILVVGVQSFNAGRHGIQWGGFTTSWYSALTRNQPALHAAGISLLLATASTIGSTVLGTLLAVALGRGRFIGRRATELTLQTVIVVPDIVMAVALLMFYAAIRERLGVLEPGLLTMTIAHITFQIPFVTLVVRARLAGLDPSLSEAAHDLGATGWQTFLHVTLPLIRPGILAGALLAFTLSLDDYVISSLTTGPGATTLPILIYSSVKRGITPDINALSTLLVLASVMATTAVMSLQARSSKFPIAKSG